MTQNTTPILPSDSTALPQRHMQVRDELRRRIGSEWAPGTRLPPIQQLAEQMGVGLQTLHRAVQNLAAEGLLISRRRLGTFVSPNLDRRQLESQGSEAGGHLRGKTIRVAHSAKDAMLKIITASLRRTLEEAGGRILDVAALSDDNTLPDDSPADAMVLINPNSHPPVVCAQHEVLLVITTGGRVPVSRVGGFDVVTVDQEQGAFLAGHRLRQAGCRHACFLGARHNDPNISGYGPTSATRLRGFEMGWDQPVPAAAQLMCDRYRVEAGAMLVAEYLRLAPRPDAVFAASDEIAVGFILGGITQGLRPGRDYQIVGFDGQQIGRELSEGPLTTVAVPTDLMGERGAELLIDRLKNPEQPVRRLSLGCSLSSGATVVDGAQAAEKK